ncbi:MAG: hypothetical protein EOQ69_16705 [Mesorhizobium sp.]|nr:MAG: hypothetical protein EOQ28_25460 [Mesorhizobium sp.]RWB97581.1 MAG: hypothetical protein EOQ57_24380 [Mesorhizobium sp.]RWG82356.1 MAG: hypothetical protein EOQ69_16705 [Mesorhizobium sp.]RWG87035.1 MAG: hypothetical protein EOQ70_14920 [Mesorhizobium sp.]RWK03129.1 MAG: hypothetical protein EOR42_19285 [Mesorhizobium sp.]
MSKWALLRAPLWPVGHLPHLGGDQTSPVISPIPNVGRMSGAPEQPISPLVGEMSGRTEGGAVEQQHQTATFI